MIEDSDQQSPALPPSPNIYRAQLFIDTDVPAGQLVNVIQDKDELWQNPVPPVAARLFRHLPYLMGHDYFEYYSHPFYGRTFGTFVEIDPRTFF